MVDWDRVEELRSKGVGWDKVAADPKVGFHPEASAGNPGHALRALYHRNRTRIRAKASERSASAGTADKRALESKWTVVRIFYLLVPLIGIWLALAYLVPSPIGLLLPAFPWLGLILAVVALVLIYLLWRSGSAPRWTRVYRNTVIGGVVLGLVVAGLIGLTGAIAFGCPILPPQSSLTPVSSSGWDKVSTSAWQGNGAPVLFFYGATWCPYCSASSWAVWKALAGFGAVSGTSLGYSSASDVDPQTPEVVLASVGMGPKSGYAPAVDFQAAEDQSGVQGTVPGTASCTQQAYVSSYASGIPFVVINGQYVHQGSLVDPGSLKSWEGSGAFTVQSAVAGENTSAGSPWLPIQSQTYWTMAFLVVTSGKPLSTLANDYGWSAATKAAVTTDVSLIG